MSLNDGLLTVEFEPAHDVTLGRLRSLIREQGFTPREAHARMVVRVQEHDGVLSIADPNDGVFHPARGAPATLEELARYAGGTATVEVEIPAGEGDVSPDQEIVVTSVLGGGLPPGLPG